MATVYIVTTGSYSDYSIRRVFLDEKKANIYASTLSDSQVEEWETDDDAELNLFKTITATYEITPEGYRSFHLTMSTYTQLDSNKELAEKSMYFDAMSTSVNPREWLEITRLVPLSTTYDEAEKRYERVCEDLYAEIRSLIENEGWSDDMVDQWLDNKGRWKKE